jgi:hypothetical protein
MPGKMFMLQVGGRHPLADLDEGALLDGRVRTATVLRAVVRDQAALQGLLRRISGLGLNLVEVHESSDQADDAPGREAQDLIPPRRVFEVTIDGPIGDLVEETLADHIEIVGVSTRYTFTDTALMGDVLTQLLARGVGLEHATELPESRYARPSTPVRATSHGDGT